MKSSVKNYRQAPRKVRLIANLVRGKRVEHALDILSHIQKRAAKPFAKLIEGAVSNAKEQGLPTEELKISKVQVDKGFTFKRYRPRARGRASKIDKHTSHIRLELGK
jgi:large subunit ribosomal protein L22